MGWMVVDGQLPEKTHKRSITCSSSKTLTLTALPSKTALRGKIIYDPITYTE